MCIVFCSLCFPDLSSQLFFQRCFDHTVIHEQYMVRFEVHEAELARMVRGVGDVAIEGHLSAILRFLSDVAELEMLVYSRGRVAHHETQVVELVFGVELYQQLCIIQ